MKCAASPGGTFEYILLLVIVPVNTIACHKLAASACKNGH
jgi:hypothetical protein